MRIEATRPATTRYRSSARFDTGISDLFATALRWDRLGVVDREHRLTTRQISELAGGMQTELIAAGVVAGDVVTIQLPNRWDGIAAMQAVWGLGAIVNPVTPIYRGAELRAIFASARPKVVLSPTIYSGIDYPAMISQALAGVGHRATVFGLDDSFPEAAGVEFRPSPADPDDVAMLMYTSGTTGRPKGVLHTHRTLLYEATSIAETFSDDAGTVFMPSPLTHITGLLYGVLMPMVADGHVVLMDRWDPRAAVDVIEREQCTLTVAATPFLRGLVDCYADSGRTSSLRTFICGGADIPPRLVERAERVMKTAVARTYGSTEMPTLCIVGPQDLGEIRWSDEGTVIGEAQARVATESVEPPMVAGELEVSGPEMFVGYIDPDDNDDAFTADGFFRTGDLAAIRGGRISIQGRLKDLIIRGGENISAREVEDLIGTHSAVKDVAVVAIADELMGERACAVVVLIDDRTISLTDITDHLAQSGIARQKFPEALLMVSELPRTVSGKVQKYLLRAAAERANDTGSLQMRGRQRRSSEVVDEPHTLHHVIAGVVQPVWDGRVEPE